MNKAHKDEIIDYVARHREIESAKLATMIHKHLGVSVTKAQVTWVKTYLTRRENRARVAKETTRKEGRTQG